MWRTKTIVRKLEFGSLSLYLSLFCKHKRTPRRHASKTGCFCSRLEVSVTTVLIAMSSGDSPSARPLCGELSEYGRNALAVRIALAIPVGQINLPRGLRGELAAEFGVSKQLITNLWSDVSRQLAEGKTLCLTSKKRSGRPSSMTPTKIARIMDANHAARTLSVRSLSSRLEEKGLNVAKSTLDKWLKDMGAVRKKRRIKPKLDFHHRQSRVDFVLDQVDNRRRNFKHGLNTVHVDESWFYLIREHEKVRMFPGEVDVGAIKLQNKSHIPKVMFICAVTRPNPSRGFDGKVGIWRVSVLKEAKRRSKNHERGDMVEVDVTVDADWYRKWYIHELLPAIRKKMWWLKSEIVTVQQDGASPHTGKNNPRELNLAGKVEGWNIKLITQPAQSPDLNINDLGFFSSLKSRVWQESFSTCDELAASVATMYDDYDAETLERIWQSLFKIYNQVFRTLGRNDFDVEHSQTEKKQQEGKLHKVVSVDREAYERALAWLMDGDEDDEET